MLNVTPEADFLSFIAHPLANMFPMIEGTAFEELKRDIAAQGILEPIRLYQGMILDGRNRYAAGKAVGHKFSVDDFVQWEGTLAEAEAWVISTNLHRRQLTTKQKQDLIVEMIRKNSDLSDREIARQLGVSNSTVGSARERLTNSPEVRRYETFKRDWGKLSDAQCEAFVREHSADLKFLLAEVSKSNGQNPVT
jgi:ParB-like chromosome segregation protein Spo0J